MTSLFLNVYWFLRILKPALLPHANTQSPDVIAYLHVDYTTSRMSLCTNLAVYNQVKRLTTGECAFVLGQKKSSSQKGWRASNCILTFKILSKQGYIMFNGRKNVGQINLMVLICKKIFCEIKFLVCIHEITFVKFVILETQFANIFSQKYIFLSYY